MTTTVTKTRRKKPAHNVLQAINSTQWAILPEALQQIYAIAARANEESLEALEARLGKELDHTHTVTVRDGVAHIPLHGPMFRYADFFTRISGATSYQDLATDLTAALDDPNVKAIILDIDTPGGETNGCAEFAAMVYAARGRKPIKAYVSYLGCSAGYWIASAADEVVVASTAIVGSIGAVLRIVDTSAHEKALGIRTIELVSSQSPDKRLDVDKDEDRAKIQEMVDSLAAVFVADVAQHRGVTPEHVLQNYGRGGVLVGQHAIDAGLADRLGSYETLHAELREHTNSPLQGGLLAAAATTNSAATTTQSKSESNMNQNNQPTTGAAAKTGTTADAQFEVGGKIKSKVAKDVTVESGAEGTVTEVREGYLYGVEFTDGTFQWFSEDELEAVSGEASTETDPESAPEEGSTEAKGKVAKPSARSIKSLMAVGATAERERILGIQALGRPGEESVIAECVKDSSCTIADASLKLRRSESAAGNSYLTSRGKTEDNLDKPGNAAPELDGDSSAAIARSIIASHEKAKNPKGAK